MKILYAVEKDEYLVQFIKKGNEILGVVQKQNDERKPFRYEGIRGDIKPELLKIIPKEIQESIYNDHVDKAIQAYEEYPIIQQLGKIFEKSDYEDFWDYCEKNSTSRTFKS